MRLLNLVVAGSLLLCPAVAAAEAVAQPAAMLPEGATEQDVTIGTGEWAVRGKVTLPVGEGPFPGVVLVHGSGPGTLDMNVGGSTIYKDLALGLAARGVAVVRYEKRTTQHREKFKQRSRRATLDEEFVEDASSAAQLLQSLKQVDPRQVYVFGNSQGGGLAPGIANALGLAGSITMSGSPRHPGTIIQQQAEFMIGLAAGKPDELKKAEEVRAAALRLQALDREPDPDAVVLGSPLWYWRDVGAVDPIREIQALTVRGGRAAVMRGERDYLVTDADWAAWMPIAGRPGVLLKSYPKLNHIMQEGEGKMTPAEYGWTRPVSAEFIADLADWVKAGTLGKGRE